MTDFGGAMTGQAAETMAYDWQGHDLPTPTPAQTEAWGRNPTPETVEHPGGAFVGGRLGVCNNRDSHQFECRHASVCFCGATSRHAPADLEVTRGL